LGPTKSISRVVNFGAAGNVKVNTISLYALMRPFDIKVAFLLMIDCEGCEYALLDEDERAEKSRDVSN